MLKENLTDILFNQPFLYFPTFYIVKEGLMAADKVGTGAPGHYGSLPSLARLPVSQVVSNALEKNMPNTVSDVSTMASFWFPVNLVAYSIPIHFHLPAIHTSSLIWSSYMSVFKGGRDKPVATCEVAITFPSPSAVAYSAKERKR